MPFSVSQDTAANFAAAARVPALDELLIDEYMRFKVGDGVNVAANLPYLQDPTGYTPVSGGYTLPNNLISLAAAGAPVSGTVYWTPIDVGPQGMTPQSLCISVTTAAAGTSGGFLVKAGIYADRGDGGGPLLTPTGLLFSTTYGTVGTTGTIANAYTTTLKTGRYWKAFIYYTGGTAPVTLPKFTAVSSALSLSSASAAPFTPTWYHAVSGLTDLPTSAVTLVSGNSSGTCPVVSIRRA